MTNVLHFQPPRTLAHVLLEIGHSERQRTVLDAAWQVDPADYVSRGLDYQADDLDDRIAVLKSEARKMVESATGCGWGELAERLA